MNYKYLYLLVLALILVCGLLYFFKSDEAGNTVGSVSITNDYQASTTASGAGYGGSTGGALIKTGQGALGSVVITGANTGVMNFYDATTTDINKRTGNQSSTTILIASMPASAAAGTYTFDVEYTTALLLELAGGIMPTSTITWR